jgi:hypothetical protein
MFLKSVACTATAFQQHYDEIGFAMEPDNLRWAAVTHWHRILPRVFTSLARQHLSVGCKAIVPAGDFFFVLRPIE